MERVAKVMDSTYSYSICQPCSKFLTYVHTYICIHMVIEHQQHINRKLNIQFLLLITCVTEALQFQIPLLPLHTCI